MRRILLASLLFSGQAAFADPFAECPSRAFLTQGAVAATYGVNLVTGDYGLLQDNMATKGKVNATGFNPNDNFLYGWGYERQKPVRIHNDFTLEYLDIENQVSGNGFFVGDVSSTDNAYYVYRNGSDYGLFSISLDPSAANYLSMEQVVDGSTLNLRIYDMAFHPSDGYAYAVDRTGVLHRIDVTNGTSQSLGSTGESGVFGAVYFDLDANLYISRNNDGKVFRIAVDSGDYAADLFALGPSSSINDGARCALAPVVDVSDTNIDFGDAPESYGTYLKDNGARHGLSDENTLYLGKGVDGESDGKPVPLSDDESDSNDDEDGVQFATTLQSGDTAVVIVESSGDGILSAWLDSDQNGTFDSDEQIIVDKAVVAGKQPVYIEVPAGASAGSTWARFRLSSSAGMEANGGVSDGEVEDYNVNITVEGSAVNYYPSSSGWTTVAFEDNWPFEGDYDMNDLVTYLRTSIYRTNGEITAINIKGELAAVGANYHNGFGIRLPGILREQINEEDISYTINDRPVTAGYSPLEAGRYEAIFILAYNTWSYVSAGEECTFYRTEAGCGSDIQMRFNLTIPFKTPVLSDIAGVFDPFLFATPGAWHGSHFDTPPGRSYEIHLKNQHATEAFDYTLMNGSGQDASNPLLGHFYQTTKGMPWALELGNRWQYPREYRDVTHAYPQFPSFVRSEGVENPSWFTFNNAVESILFKN
ncbi:LruC domain-containing protein [Leucothrix sargassi]|nr:LruC domain-containing protein [Leucothrix sargassi]